MALYKYIDTLAINLFDKSKPSHKVVLKNQETGKLVALDYFAHYEDKVDMMLVALWWSNVGKGRELDELEKPSFEPSNI